MNKLNQEKIECDEFTVVILCMHWKFYRNDTYLELQSVKDIIKTFIVHKAKFDKDARRFCWRIIKLKKGDLNEIEEFSIKYKEFSSSTLTKNCLVFFKNKNIENVNIPNELKNKYLNC